jgi:hypothetical protein
VAAATTCANLKEATQGMLGIVGSWLWQDFLSGGHWARRITREARIGSRLN